MRFTGLTFVYEPADDSATLNGAPISGISRNTSRHPDFAGHPLDGNFAMFLLTTFSPMEVTWSSIPPTRFTRVTTRICRAVRLRNVLTHEIGHGLGLAHVCPTDGTKLMEPFINTGFQGVQFDDLYSLQRNYGDSFEKANAALDNDTFANANPVTVTNADPFSFGPLSIDDDSDVDLYAFTVRAGDTVTATVSPSPNSYLEGPQTDNCNDSSSGTLFDSSIQQDLVLTLFDPSQNQIASSNAQPAGEDETLDDAVAGTTGTYYLQVSGDSANRAQLYNLEIMVNTTPVALNLASAVQTAENYEGQNGIADPLESLEYTFTLRNDGTAGATNTTATLSGPAEFLPLETSIDLGVLAPGQETVFPFVFALDAACGDSVPLTLTVTADDNVSSSFQVNVTLGAEQTLVSEDLGSNGSALPQGWQRNSVGAGSNWFAATFTGSGTRVFFSRNPADSGESVLTTSQLGPLASNSLLSFRHLYNTQTGVDGGVLEISIAGGAFVDIIDAGGSFQTGAYTQTLNDLSNTNPLDNRSAWTGNSGTFVETEVLLPPSVNNQLVRLRWRMGHNNSTADSGWGIDTVAINGDICDPEVLAVTLSSDDRVASEFFSEDTAELTVESILPVAVAFPIPLLIFGSAEGGTDYNSLNNLLLPANTDSVTVVLNAFEDSLAEGTETFAVASPNGGPSLQYTINDAPFSTWVVDLLAGSSEQAPDDDPDGDGLRNVEEYLFGTDPLEIDLAPETVLSMVGDDLRLTLPVTTVPDDVRIIPFSSPDLDVWSESTFVSVEGNEYTLSVPDPLYFIRLGLSISETDAPAAP